jgi:hypothetical protein
MKRRTFIPIAALPFAFKPQQALAFAPDRRLSTIGAEVLVTDTTAPTPRLSTIGAEVLVTNTTAPTPRLSTIGAEVLVTDTTAPTPRLSTIGAEVLVLIAPPIFPGTINNPMVT